MDEQSHSQQLPFHGGEPAQERLSPSSSSGPRIRQGPFPPHSPPSVGDNRSTTTPTLARENNRYRTRIQRDPQVDAALREEWNTLRRNGRLVRLREKLPAFKKRDELREAVEKHRIVVVSGETGSGKTTQVPQYLYEFMCEDERGSLANIVCTQPRKIAAVSVAERVAQERDAEVGDVVGYSVRMDKCNSCETRITFCTTGVLIGRMVEDVSLRNISHIVMDEIHERGIETDLLLILLRDLIQKRDDLTVVLMSATMDAGMFSQYFDGCPIINISGRTFPVEVFHLEQVIEKVNYTLKKGSQCTMNGMERAGGQPSDTLSLESECDQMEVPHAVEDTLSRMNLEVINYDLIEKIVLYIIQHQDIPGAILIFLPGMSEILRCSKQLKSNQKIETGCVIFIMHGDVAPSERREVFVHPPHGKRKVVVGTNIMETSITIDDAVFVIDSGKVKEEYYDASRGWTQLVLADTSKASCKQRQGRAGRVRKGFCFRLFTTSQFESRSENQICEMRRVALHNILLRMHILNVGNELEFLQKAISPPEVQTIESGMMTLKAVGALTMDGRLTPLARYLARLPLDVHVGKMVVYGAMLRCVDPVLTIAACLAERAPFKTCEDVRQQVKEVRNRLSGGLMSDHLTLWFAYAEWVTACKEDRSHAADRICEELFLCGSTLERIRNAKMQYEQLLHDVGLIEGAPTSAPADKFLFPSFQGSNYMYESGGPEYNSNSDDVTCIISCVVAGFYPNTAHMAVQQEAQQPEQSETTISTPDESNVKIHTSSVIEISKVAPPAMFVYVKKTREGSATFLRDVSVIKPLHIIFFGNVPMRYDGETRRLEVDGTYVFICQPMEALSLLHLRIQLDQVLQLKGNGTDGAWGAGRAKTVAVILQLLRRGYPPPEADGC